MYDTNMREGNFYGGYPYGQGCCRPMEYNFYRWPAAAPKEMKRLDVVELIIHTDEFVYPACVPDRCCNPEEVIVKDSIDSFIIVASTNAMEPVTNYTMYMDRKVPCEAFPLDTYVKTQPAGFYRGRVGLRRTKIVHEHLPEGFALQRATYLPGLGKIDNVIYKDEGGCGEGDCGHGPIPSDPAFPAQHYVNYRHGGPGMLVPVKLDLEGNIATGDNFSTGYPKLPGNGAPYNNRFVLFYNNAGEFVFHRNARRRSDFA